MGRYVGGWMGGWLSGWMERMDDGVRMTRNRSEKESDRRRKWWMWIREGHGNVRNVS